jgi:Ca2+/Na+ antiporter
VLDCAAHSFDFWCTDATINRTCGARIGDVREIRLQGEARGILVILAFLTLAGPRPAESRGLIGTFPRVDGTGFTAWRRGGRGIAASFQLNSTTASTLKLPARLVADTAVCVPGTPEYAELGKIKPEGTFLPCCDDRGLFMPIIPYEYLWDNNLRAFLYIISLLWCFIGVSVLADAFMAGIEAVTSTRTKKERPRTHRDGTPVHGEDGKQIVDIVEDYVWNEKVCLCVCEYTPNPAITLLLPIPYTLNAMARNEQVACLTLFALGSSAPEILIACVGCAPEFYEDALGPVSKSQTHNPKSPNRLPFERS